MAEKEKKLKNEFRLRLYNTEIIKSIEELMQTGKFQNYNDLLGYALGFGIEKVYLEFGKKKALSNPLEVEVPEKERLSKIEKAVAENTVMLEDLFILQNSSEVLMTTLYNVLRAKYNGDESSISSELMDKGFYATLPDFYNEIKASLVKRYKNKAQRKGKYV